jgi:hypothetical protein
VAIARHIADKEKIVITEAAWPLLKAEALRLHSLPADSGTALDVAGNDRGRHRAGRRRPRRPQNCRRTH